MSTVKEQAAAECDKLLEQLRVFGNGREPAALLAVSVAWVIEQFVRAVEEGGEFPSSRRFILMCALRMEEDLAEIKARLAPGVSP